MSERVTLVPYDSDWPRRFDQEAAILGAIFAGSVASIKHVGSTAVPGLGAKPVLDMMVGLEHLAEVEKRIAPLEAAGYEYVQEYETQLPQRRYFRKPLIGPRAYHLHCVTIGSDFWIRHLAFRDYLRAHPESAAAYYELKQALAQSVSKAEYTEAKSSFIENILSTALRFNGQPTAQQSVQPDRREDAAPG